MASSVHRSHPKRRHQIHRIALRFSGYILVIPESNGLMISSSAEPANTSQQALRPDTLRRALGTICSSAAHRGHLLSTTPLPPRALSVPHPSRASSSPPIDTHSKNLAASSGLHPTAAVLAAPTVTDAAASTRVSSAAAAAAMTGQRPFNWLLANDGFTPGGYVSPAPKFRFLYRGHMAEASP